MTPEQYIEHRDNELINKLNALLADYGVGAYCLLALQYKSVVRVPDGLSTGPEWGVRSFSCHQLNVELRGERRDNAEEALRTAYYNWLKSEGIV